MNVASKKVLVLNKKWQAIGVRNLKRAMGLLCKKDRNGEPYARVVDTRASGAYTWSDWSKMRPRDGEDTIRSASATHRLPKVIVLYRYDKFPNQSMNCSRRGIFKRDNNTCMYCKCRPGTELLTIDHIVPRSQGGITSWTNCCACCLECNIRKGGKTPSQAGLKLLKQPAKPDFMLISSDVIVEDWHAFISELYWTIPLE